MYFKMHINGKLKCIENAFKMYIKMYFKVYI